MEKETEQLLDLKGEENLSLLEIDTTIEPLVKITMLPSGFKGYPKGTTISYKPITIEELESLNSTDPDLDRNFALILKSIRCNTMKPEDLYYWDVIYIGVQRLLTALGGTTGEFPALCPKCGKVVYKKASYTELDFKQLEVPALPMKMEVAGRQLEFGLPSVKQFLQLSPEAGEVGFYATLIKNMEPEEALKFVKNLTGIDIKKLRFVDKQLDYGIRPFTVKCKCGAQVQVEVTPFGVVFPEDEFRDDIEFEVQYG